MGLPLIVAGLILVSSPGLGTAHGARTWLGDLLFALDAVLWGLFTVLARQWRVDPVRVTAVVWVLALAYVPIYFAVFGGRLLAAPPGEVLFQAAYQGIGVAVAALPLYAWAVRVLGAERGSLVMPLVPIFAVLMAIPALGEVPTTLQLAGMLGVSAGMVLAAGERRRREA